MGTDMEEKGFADIYGGKIVLQQQSYKERCRECTVTCPKLSLRSLSACTCAVWLAAYAGFALTENSVVLSAAIFVTFIGLLLYLHFVKIDQESLLVIGSLGIQMTSSFASGRESTAFIEMCRVKDVVINEAVFMQKVIYYLCILLKDPSDPNGIAEIVPVFQSSKPRLDCLVEVYRTCQDILSQKSSTGEASE
ncbi:phosphatidylinositol N-acetylglucosaminyltransferase subunit H [Ascaphus truei]|uniref:phosphatidylinositol N-acetylglucosaminyltransferase subunit H n=1 Tax=Ascaphus truei TaxID=8439 RepID=UPI003F5ADCA1